MPAENQIAVKSNEGRILAHDFVEADFHQCVDDNLCSSLIPIGKHGSVLIAVAGISVLAAGAFSQLWISLTLCATFALYGLLRKIVPADAVTGLGVETAMHCSPSRNASR